MKSLKLDNGDFVFDSLGKLKLVSDKDMLCQSINLRIQTEIGELFYNDGYGRPKIKGKLTKDALQIFLNQTLLKDTRINDVKVQNFTSTVKGKIDASILILLNNNELINLNILI